MKKNILLFVFLVLLGKSYALIDTLKYPNKKVKLSKIEVTKLTVDKKKEEEFHKIIYGSHGFVEKIEITIIETYGVEGEGLIKRFNKRVEEYFYNNKNELTQECAYKYSGKTPIQVYNAAYTYDNWGYLKSFTIFDKDIEITRKFEYDENCLLSLAVRKMPNINYNILWDYQYSKNNDLIRLDLKSGDKDSNTKAMVFDQNKNPKQLIFPEKYCLAFPEKLGNHNPVKIIEKGKKYLKKDLFKHSYNPDGYVGKSVNQHFEKNKLKETITTIYFYQ